MQVLYTLYTDSASKNLNCSFVLHFFSPFDVCVAVCSYFFSDNQARSAQLQLHENQTLHLFACVCVYVWMMYVNAYSVC